MKKTLRSNWLTKCPSCKKVKRLSRGTSVSTWNGKPSITCTCGKTMIAKLIKGVHSDEECSEKCLAATGPACSCTCGGENHGKNHA